MIRVSVLVSGEANIAEAAREARHMATALGFAGVQTHYIATAASELAANLFIHAGGGVFEVSALSGLSDVSGLSGPRGLELVTTDHGPGIADVAKALQDGYSTAGSLGCGLPGVQRLMDELNIDTQPGLGTVVRARKWL